MVVNRQHQKKKGGGGWLEACGLKKNPVKFISLWFLSLLLFSPTHNSRTSGPLSIILVPEDSKCSTKHPLCFSNVSVKQKKGIKGEQSGEYRRETSSVGDSHRSAIWFVQFLLLVNC